MENHKQVISKWIIYCELYRETEDLTLLTVIFPITHLSILYEPVYWHFYLLIFVAGAHQLLSPVSQKHLSLSSTESPAHHLGTDCLELLHVHVRMFHSRSCCNY